MASIKFLNIRVEWKEAMLNSCVLFKYFLKFFSKGENWLV